MQKLDNDTRLRAALFLVNVLSGLLFTAAGKSAIYTLALPSNNGVDSMSYVLLFPSRWELRSVPVIFGDDGKKLWVMDEMFLL